MVWKNPLGSSNARSFIHICSLLGQLIKLYDELLGLKDPAFNSNSKCRVKCSIFLSETNNALSLWSLTRITVGYISISII